MLFHQAAGSIEKDTVVFPHLPDVARPVDLPLDVFAARLARAPVKSLTPRQQLFREGDHKANIYQVLVGAFVLYRLLPNGRRQVTGFAVTGDMVGLGAGTCHRCSAAASGEAKVRALPAR